MTIADLTEETIAALSANKVRSGLTILGIVIGIAAVIAMVSIGAGAQASIRTSIQGLGANLLTIRPGAAQQGGRGAVFGGRGAVQSLKVADADALKSIASVSNVSPEVQSRYQVVSPTGTNTNTTVIGATDAYPAVHLVTLSDGAFFSESQLKNQSRVAVLGPTTASDLFGTDSPVGKVVRINGMQFKVVGVTASKGSAGFTNPDDTVLVPLTTMQALLSRSEYVSAISVQVAEEGMMASAKEEATALLLEKHKVAEADFNIVSQEDILGTLTSVTQSFTAFLASVAGISLVVGGIGIMNMMLTTVTERTKEIGLRKAIGAKRREIEAQFLMEAVLLTLIGGGLGIGLGWGVAQLATKLFSLATQVTASSVGLAFGVSAGIGIVFGWYPAQRASKLSPIQALRYE